MNRSLIKLLNGETIICSIVNESDTHVTISDPLKLEIVNHGGIPSMMTTYWIPLPDEELRVDIKQNHVIMVSDITDDMELFYMRALRHARGKEEQDTESIIEKRKMYGRLSALGLTSNTVFH